jgi:AraC-like DNA-binding protein
MQSENLILFFFSALGIFNGFITGLYFIFFTKQKRLSNYFLGILILLLCIRIGKSFLVIFFRPVSKDILQVGLSSCFLIGPALYFYLKATIQNIKKISKSWKIHILILISIIVIVGLIYPYRTNYDFWNPHFVHYIYLVWIFYILLSGYVLRDIFKKLFSKSTKLKMVEKWLIAIFLGNFLICTAYMIGYFYIYFIGPVSYSFVFYALIIFLLFRNNREAIFEKLPEKYSDKEIENASELILQLNNLMQDEKLYKNPNIKLNDIALKLGISSHLLSQLLNDNVGKSFSEFINEYRVEEAKLLIKNNNKFTLEAIGFDAGFSSKSNFYTTFKKTVGITPAQFKKD